MMALMVLKPHCRASGWFLFQFRNQNMLLQPCSFWSMSCTQNMIDLMVSRFFTHLNFPWKHQYFLEGSKNKTTLSTVYAKCRQLWFTQQKIEIIILKAQKPMTLTYYSEHSLKSPWPLKLGCWKTFLLGFGQFSGAFPCSHFCLQPCMT